MNEATNLAAKYHFTALASSRSGEIHEQHSKKSENNSPNRQKKRDAQKRQDDWLPMRFLPDIDHDLLRSRCRSRPFLNKNSTTRQVVNR
jgi:hypothetical protein